ncbi:MAG: hypothetical protein WAW91_02140 [Candidatus Nanoperiomorbaceae bacterium]
MTKLAIDDERNFLFAINHLVNVELFRQLWMSDGTDAAADGDSSCALVVSSILLLFGLIPRKYATVRSLLNELRQNGYRASTDFATMQPGDVVHFATGKTGNEHVGFCLKNDLVDDNFVKQNVKLVSNDSNLGVPKMHGFTLRDGREPVEFFSQKML